MTGFSINLKKNTDRQISRSIGLIEISCLKEEIIEIITFSKYGENSLYNVTIAI